MEAIARPPEVCPICRERVGTIAAQDGGRAIKVCAECLADDIRLDGEDTSVRDRATERARPLQ